MPADDSQLPPRAALVRRLAAEQGFALVGIAPARPTEHAAFLHRWLADNKHCDMAFLRDQLEERLDPNRLAPDAKCVICVADRYAGAEEPSGRVVEGTRDHPRDTGSEGHGNTERATEPRGRIARYAWGDDYHRVMKKRLHAIADALRERWPEHQFRTTVDSAPILEREQALRAGLGWVGKNTMLIHATLGSFLLLGEIVTTLPIQPDEDAGYPAGGPADHCGTCTRCIDACPTQCLTPYTIDASLCVSYLTIEHKGAIDESLHAGMGGWIAGCDVCQEVCPFNKEGAEDARDPLTTSTNTADTVSDARRAPHHRYTTRPPAPAIPLLDLLNWDADARRRAFERSALKRIKLDQLKRNAIIAAGNALARQDDVRLRARIDALARDVSEPELVRATAAQVLRRLGAR